MPPVRPGFRQFVRQPAVSLPLATFVLVLIFIGWDTWTSRRNAEEAAFAVLDVHDKLAATAIATSFAEIDARLREMVDLRLAAGKLDPQRLSAEFDRRRALMPNALALMTIGPDGRVDAHTDRRTLGYDASGREHFRVHAQRQAGPSEVFISQPFLATIQVPVITITRPILDAGGQFRGVAGVAVSLEQLTRLLEPATPAGGTISLVGRDGLIYTHLPDPETQFGKSLPELRIEPASGRGNHQHLHLPADGERPARLATTRPVGNFGLTIKASLPESQVFADWEAALRFRILLLVTLAVLLVGIGRYSWRQQLDTQRTNARFASLVENSSDMTVILDRDGIARYISPAAQTIGGMPPETGIGLHFLQFAHPDDRDALREGWERLIAVPGTVVRSRYRTRHAHQGWLWVEAYSRSLFDVPGIDGVLLLVRDISDRVAAEAQLRLNEETLRSAQSVAHIGSWHLDGPTGTLRWSEETYRIFGIPPGAPISMERFIECIHPEDRDMVLAEWDAAQRGEPYDIGHRIIAGDDILWVQEKADLRFDAQGQLLFATGTVQDVTAQHNAAKQLSELLEFTERIIAESPAGIAVFRADGPCVLANESLAAITGGTREQLRNQNFRRLTSWRSLGLLDAAMEAMQSSKAVRRVISGRTSFGRDIEAECEFVAITRQGEPHLLLLMRDISEYRSAERAQREAARLAEETSRSKSEFLANMSHEIRTPMNAVIGLAQLALDHASDDTLRDYLRQMYSSTSALLAVINDILDYSKIEAGHLPLDVREFGVRDLIGGLNGLFSAACKRKGLSLDPVIATDLPDRFNGDPTRINQILTNLVGNAVKFTETGRIGIEVRSIGKGKEGRHRLRFTVSDTGIGMDEAALSRLFQPFVQADGSITRRYGGTGLGLSISRRLALLMGGDIRVESVSGAGSRFHLDLELPLANDASAAAAGEPAAVGLEERDLRRLAAPIAGASVLLIEDDPVNQRVVRGLLEHVGLQVRVAADGEAGLAALAEHRPDAVLMDLQMPVLDGFEATRRIRAEPAWKSLPVIAFTASVLVNDRQRCQAAGMDDFVAKPAQPREIIAALLRQVPLRVDPTNPAPAMPMAPSPAPASAAFVVPDSAGIAHALDALDDRLAQSDFITTAEIAALRLRLAAFGPELAELASRLEAAISSYDYARARTLLADVLAALRRNNTDHREPPA